MPVLQKQRRWHIGDKMSKWQHPKVVKEEKVILEFDATVKTQHRD